MDAATQGNPRGKPAGWYRRLDDPFPAEQKAHIHNQGNSEIVQSIFMC